MSEVSAIAARLRQAATEEGRAALQKFVPTSNQAYGVRVPVINGLAREYSGGGRVRGASPGG